MIAGGTETSARNRTRPRSLSNVKGYRPVKPCQRQGPFLLSRTGRSCCLTPRLSRIRIQRGTVAGTRGSEGAGLRVQNFSPASSAKPFSTTSWLIQWLSVFTWFSRTNLQKLDGNSW